MECFACNQVPYFDPATGLVDASCILRPSRTEAAEEAPLNGIDLLTRKEGYLCPVSELPVGARYRKDCGRFRGERRYPDALRLQAAAGAPAGFKGRMRMLNSNGQRKSSTSRLLPLMMCLSVLMGMGLWRVERRWPAVRP